MPRFRWWWSLPVVPLAIWGGCSLLSYDHAARIVDAAMHNPNGDLDAKAFGAALSAKFPNGVNADELNRFVAAIGGTCHEGPARITVYCGGPPETRPTQCATEVHDTLRCDVPLSGTICVANMLAIQAHLSPAREISDITARKRMDAC